MKAARVGLAAAWTLFQLYTAQAGLYDLLIQLPLHAAFAVALAFLTDPIPESAAQAEALRRRPKRRWPGALGALLAPAPALLDPAKTLGANLTLI